MFPVRVSRSKKINLPQMKQRCCPIVETVQFGMERKDLLYRSEHSCLGFGFLSIS